jgi:hypothetical protein
MALLCSITQLAHAQNPRVSAPEVEQRIQHVIAGLTGGVVILFASCCAPRRRKWTIPELQFSFLYMNIVIFIYA